MTEHFSFDELTNTSHSNLLDDNRDSAKKFMKHLKYIACTLEEIRAVLKVPMKITSGFRGYELNKAVGGSKTSGHTKGLCADFIPVGIGVKEAYQIILENSDKFPSLKKAIFEKVGDSLWIHIETKTEASQKQQFFTTQNGKTYTEIHS